MTQSVLLLYDSFTKGSIDPVSTQQLHETIEKMMEELDDGYVAKIFAYLSDAPTVVW